VRFVVADRGTGMPAAVRARAGEPFYTTRAEGAGMGLGLFVTTSTVEQLGGTVEIESIDGAGTTVTIRLPEDAAGRS
jgi:two-component system sensor histidine kinase RegB